MLHITIRYQFQTRQIRLSIPFFTRYLLHCADTLYLECKQHCTTRPARYGNRHQLHRHQFRRHPRDLAVRLAFAAPEVHQGCDHFRHFIGYYTTVRYSEYVLPVVAEPAEGGGPLRERAKRRAEGAGRPKRLVCVQYVTKDRTCNEEAKNAQSSLAGSD